jgi:hydrogenase maturation protein HypF
MALGHLHTAGIDLVAPELLGLLGAKEQEARVLRRMIDRGLNAPLTSSLGRLFDAVAALVLGRGVVDYEAQAAIELEGFAAGEPLPEPKAGEPGALDSAGYPVEFLGGDWNAREDVRDPVRISTAPLWRELWQDLRNGVGKPLIAARFHAGVAAAFVRAAVLARAATGIQQVALSGGCLHNRRLARLLRAGLEEEGFRVFQDRTVSPGDGGLSYGQAVVAAAKLRGGLVK